MQRLCSSLYTRGIVLFGSPHSIRTDAGTEFANKLLSDIMLKIGVHIKISAPYNHQCNLVERFHRTLWKLLRANVANSEKDREKSLPAVELAYNSSIHASLGCSPARFFLGREVGLEEEID